MAPSHPSPALDLSQEFAILSPRNDEISAGSDSDTEISDKLTYLHGKLQNMKSRLELRKMAEAAEAREAEGDEAEKGDKKRKKGTAASAKKAPKAKKPRSKQVERRRIVWVIFNNTQKEEGRFPYEQRKEADEKIELLRSKSKRLYWLQAVKESLGGAALPPGSKVVVAATKVPEVVVEEAEEEEEEEEAEEEEEEDEDEE